MFKHQKRTFISPVSTGHTSYILAEVEDSKNGEYPWGHCMLTLADCRRRIQLEFFLGTKRRRKESLKKINLLISNLIQFGHALKTEADLIDQFQKASKKKRKKATK